MISDSLLSFACQAFAKYVDPAAMKGHEKCGTGTFDGKLGSRFNAFLDHDLVHIAVLDFTLAYRQRVFRSNTGLLKAFQVLDLLLTFEPSRLQVRLGHFAFEHRGFELDHLFVAERSQELRRSFCNDE